MKRSLMLFAALAISCLSSVAQLKMPAYERSVLPNGVTVFTLVKKDVPLVTLKAVVKGGGESEVSVTAGLADITNDLLLRGTKKRSADQIAQDIDFLGAEISTASAESANEVELEVLSKDVTEGIGILGDLLLSPTFPEDEVAKELARAVDGAKARKDRPQSSIAAYANKFFFGPSGHPMGIVADEESLGRITRENIVAYHTKYYVGANLVIVAVGDFDPVTVKAEIAKIFGSAPKGESFHWKPAQELTRAAKSQLLLVDDADSTQTYFRIIQPGISRTSPDRIPMLVVNTLFGGRFTSMLNDELRVNAGLTYGATSQMDQDRLPGALTISTFTATKTTGEAIDLALAVLNTLRSKGISAEQLASAKEYIKGSAPTSLLETSDQLANVLTTFAIYGLDDREINEFFARIDAVTIEDAKRVIATYYRDDGLTFVVLGQRSEIEPALRKYADDIRVVDLNSTGIQIPVVH